MRNIVSRVLLLVLFMVGVGYNASAHTMWMSLAKNSTSNDVQTVNIYFGEYSDGKPTPYARWFSNLKEVAVFIENPDGKVIQLTDGTASDDCLSFSFSTQNDGLYKVYFEHEVKDVFKGMKITYASVVLYGKNYDQSGKIGFYGIDLLWKKIGDSFFTYLENNKAKQGVNITAAKGGQKDGDLTLVSGKKGKTSFGKDANGDYLLEVVVKKDVTEQSHNGKPYEVDYKMFTFKVEF